MKAQQGSNGGGTGPTQFLHPGPSPGTPGQPKRCIVIGAGFAGLGAARNLVSQAPDKVVVTVLEAGPSVGGRARAGKVSPVPTLWWPLALASLLRAPPV